MSTEVLAENASRLLKLSAAELFREAYKAVEDKNINVLSNIDILLKRHFCKKTAISHFEELEDFNKHIVNFISWFEWGGEPKWEKAAEIVDKWKTILELSQLIAQTESPVRAYKEIKKSSYGERLIRLLYEKKLMKPVESTLKSVILVNAKTDHPFQEGSRISVIIESEDIESLVAGKYIDRLYHLLKTPLHSILGIADQLRRKSAAPRYNEYYLLLDNTIIELSTAISRLLELSKLEFRHLKPELEIINFSKMIESIRREFSGLARKKKITFDSNIADGISIRADRNMVKTVIENILDNALKYTITGEISLNLLDAGSTVNVVIKDTGIGIPDDEIGLIFHKKFRGKHPIVQQMDGQGIGLYQCWHFVTLNKGKIYVTSVPGKGSDFTIVFPKKIEDL